MLYGVENVKLSESVFKICFVLAPPVCAPVDNISPLLMNRVCVGIN